jgi:pimeloyl-ACP methyl ester carboxylesterase
MRFISETTIDGVSQRQFTLDGVPGVLWSATGAIGDRPLILLAHGGGQHSKAPGIVARAGRYVAAGFTALAIDAPGHGDRPKTERDQRFSAGIRARIAAGEPVGQYLAELHADLAARAVPEWRAILDALGTGGPVGFCGMSQGAAIGVHLIAAEPRIAAAVLGLAGHQDLTETASRITVPVEFLLQWDDHLVPRDSGLALFDAIASREKSLHANPGRHGEVPTFELDASVRFFARHLPGADDRQYG